jgi:hypothetical protein
MTGQIPPIPAYIHLPPKSAAGQQRLSKGHQEYKSETKSVGTVQVIKRSIHFCRTQLNYIYGHKKQTKHYLFFKYYC